MINFIERARKSVLLPMVVILLSVLSIAGVTDLVVDGNGICSRAVNFINQIKISHGLYLNQSAVWNYSDNEPWTFGNLTKATSSDVTTGTDDAKYATAKALYDAGIRANDVQQIHNYTQDFTINSALNGALITNHGATTDITGTFASGLPAGFWVDVANEADSLYLNASFLLHFENNLIETISNTTGTNSSATFTTGKIGSYALACSSNQFAYFADQPFFQFNNSKTLSFWIYFVSLPSSGQFHQFMSQGTNGSNYMSAIMDYRDSSLTFGLQYCVADSWDTLMDSGNFNWQTDTWYHIVYTFNDHDVKLYINGTLNNSITSTIDYPNYSGAFEIGVNYSNSGNGFNGCFDEFAIFNKILSTDEIAELYNAGTGKIIAPLSITLTPASGEQLPGTAAADNTLISSTAGDVKNFFNTGNSWISKYTTGTWTDGL